MAFTDFLDPILGPFLSLPAFWAVVLLSAIVSIIITVIYKYTTNQELMKDLKAEIKEFQQQLKTLRNKPDEFMKVQKQAMQTNMKYMGHSFRATIYTLIPVIFIFAWMTGHFTYNPIAPNQEFTVTVQFSKPVEGTIELIAPNGVVVQGDTSKEVSGDDVFWTLSGESGRHTLEFTYDQDTVKREVIITTQQEYLPPVHRVDLVNSDISTITVDHEKKKIMNLLGWKLGWLGTYIIFSILFSIGFRKVLKVY